MCVESRIYRITDFAKATGELAVSDLGQDFFIEEQASKLIIHPYGVKKIPSFLNNGSGQILWTAEINWLEKFMEINNLSVGDNAYFLRVSQNEYRVLPLWKHFTFIDLFSRYQPSSAHT